MAPLRAALALAVLHDSSVGIAQHLDLEMAGAPDEVLDVQVATAKRALRLGATALERLGDGSGLADRARPTASGAGEL